MGTIAHTRGWCSLSESSSTDSRGSTFFSPYRSFCFITRETRLKNVSPAVEGETTFMHHISIDPNDHFVSRRMSFPLHDSDKLIKQTYSVYVFLPEDEGQDITRKWHLSM